MRQYLFSLNMSNDVSKNPSFYTDFKNVHFTFVKKCIKNDFLAKTF
jgi:hypothetical protein